MPFRMAALAYPAFAAALYLGLPNAVADFEKAGAISPETSRRPDSLGISRKRTKKAAAKGLLVALGDGRYYVNQAAVRKSDRKKMIAFVLALLSFLPLLWLMW